MLKRPKVSVLSLTSKVPPEFTVTVVAAVGTETGAKFPPPVTRNVPPLPTVMLAASVLLGSRTAKAPPLTVKELVLPMVFVKPVPELALPSCTLPPETVADSGVAASSGTLIESVPVLVAKALMIDLPVLLSVRVLLLSVPMVMLAAVPKSISPTVMAWFTFTVLTVGEPVNCAISPAVLGNGSPVPERLVQLATSPQLLPFELAPVH